jgi:thiosulfate dehydrogenase [quinone] large subunit
MSFTSNTGTLDPGGRRMVPGYLLSILRIYLGVILLFTVYGKLTADTPFSDEMLNFLNTFLSRGRMAPFYTHFIKGFVIPHANVFSFLVMLGELAAGLSLLTGSFTRIGAFIAMVLFLNYMLAKGRWFWSPDSEDAAVFFIALVVFMGGAGRVAGFDKYLSKYPALAPLC